MCNCLLVHKHFVNYLKILSIWTRYGTRIKENPQEHCFYSIFVEVTAFISIFGQITVNLLITICSFFYFSAMKSLGSTLAGIGEYFRAEAVTSSDAERNPAPAPAPRPAAPAPAAHPAPASSRPGCGGKETLTAEVLWAMKYVESHYSCFRRCFKGIQLLTRFHAVKQNADISASLELLLTSLHFLRVV